jgi:hypothetical protein
MALHAAEVTLIQKACVRLTACRSHPYENTFGKRRI